MSMVTKKIELTRTSRHEAYGRIPYHCEDERSQNIKTTWMQILANSPLAESTFFSPIIGRTESLPYRHGSFYGRQAHVGFMPVTVTGCGIP
jgi:hypothetical protein